MDVIRQSAENIERDLADLAAFGSDGRGVTRLAYTGADAAAHRRLEALMQEAGLETSYDAVGNLSGVWRTSASTPVVMVGSHLDTVPSGGRFDGVAGVVIGLEAVRRLRSRGFVPARPIEVISFRNEEGARWGAGFTGSRAVTGQLDPSEMESKTDASGLTESQAMRMIGLHPERAAESAREPGSIAAYIEPHIEQGPVLESLGIPLGIVTGIVGLAWLSVTLSGQASHAGAMPMHLRRDALAGAAEIILGIEEAARCTNGLAVATVGRIEVSPGATNVVPGGATFTVDCRSMTQGAIDDLVARVRSLAGEVASRRGLSARVAVEHCCSPVELSGDMIELLADSAAAVGAPFHRLYSGAAHDAMNIAAIAPAGMLFIRSIGGISHSPDETTQSEDLALAAAVLEEALARLAC